MATGPGAVLRHSTCPNSWLGGLRTARSRGGTIGPGTTPAALSTAGVPALRAACMPLGVGTPGAAAVTGFRAANAEVGPAISLEQRARGSLAFGRAARDAANEARSMRSAVAVRRGLVFPGQRARFARHAPLRNDRGDRSASGRRGRSGTGTVPIQCSHLVDRPPGLCIHKDILQGPTCRAGTNPRALIALVPSGCDRGRGGGCPRCPRCPRSPGSAGR